MALYRSLLFVPGNNERFIAKSRSLGADIICLDLEDSVPPDQKEAARRTVRAALDSEFDSAVFVRTNSPASGMMERDVEAVLCDGLDGIVIPKVDDPGDVRRAHGMAGPGKEIIPSIESARGVVNAHAIASCEGASALVFGIFDLLHDMRTEYGGHSEYARSKVPVDARAAGIPAIDSVWQDIRDAPGLERDCSLGRGMGYSGKSLIHPGQIDAAHRAFAPAPEEAAWAREVCAAYEESLGSGRGATTVRGKMVDEVHYKQAKRLLGSLE